MEIHIKKNRNTEMICAGKKEKGQVEITSLNSHFIGFVTGTIFCGLSR